jgi:hypothetical protein
VNVNLPFNVYLSKKNLSKKRYYSSDLEVSIINISLLFLSFLFFFSFWGGPWLKAFILGLSLRMLVDKWS